MNKVPVTKKEELTIFVERLTHFLNLWTVYNDMLKGHYIPSIGNRDKSLFDPSISVMLVLYAYFYSLIDDSTKGLDAFRIWRKHFPQEEPAIMAIETQIMPFKADLRMFRNRLGFHGSRTRKDESRGFDLFANTSGTQVWNAIQNFKALATILLRKEMAQRNGDDAAVKQSRAWIDFVANRAKEETKS